MSNIIQIHCPKLWVAVILEVFEAAQMNSVWIGMSKSSCECKRAISTQCFFLYHAKKGIGSGCGGQDSCRLLYSSLMNKHRPKKHRMLCVFTYHHLLQEHHWSDMNAPRLKVGPTLSTLKLLGFAKQICSCFSCVSIARMHNGWGAARTERTKGTSPSFKHLHLSIITANYGIPLGPFQSVSLHQVSCACTSK